MPDVAKIAGPEHTAILEDYLAEDELAAQLRKSIHAVRRWRENRTGPSFVAIGKTIYYRRSAVVEWLTRNEQQVCKLAGDHGKR